jgi:hypothetical protein
MDKLTLLENYGLAPLLPRQQTAPYLSKDELLLPCMAPNLGDSAGGRALATVTLDEALMLGTPF